MEIKKTDPKIKAQFIALTAVTIGIVTVGWFFSFRDLWQSSDLSLAPSFSKMTELKDEVKNVTSDFKENIQPVVSEVSETVKETNEVINEENEKQQTAEEVIGEMMKQKLEQTNQVVEPTN